MHSWLSPVCVGFESGNKSSRTSKGATVEQAREFMKNCKRLALLFMATSLLGCPVTPETRELKFAQELDCETIQVSLAHAYPGTDFYNFRS